MNLREKLGSAEKIFREGVKKQRRPKKSRNKSDRKRLKKMQPIVLLSLMLKSSAKLILRGKLKSAVSML